MKYGFKGFCGDDYYNCMLIPTIYFSNSKITFEVALRFLWWGIGFYVYEKEGKK